MKAETALEVTNSPAENGVKGKVEKKSGKRIGYNYIILKSLKESQKNDVVKCLYIKSLTNFGICVIKEGSYGDSKDKDGRDIKDRLLWQKQLHEELQDNVRLPRYIGSFEENGNYYLVIERIKGQSLYKVCKDNSKHLHNALITGNKLGITFLNYMIEIVILLEDLHRHYVIHRDVTATNFIIMPNKKVAVIDMELSYSLRQQAPAPPFQLGTPGYMSPEQLTTQQPTVQQDIFSVGAILLQVWTGISPIKLTDASVESLCTNVHFFIPDRAFADIIVQCLQSEAGKRPSLKTVRQVITDYRDSLRKKQQRPVSNLISFTKEQLLSTIQNAISTLTSPLLVSEDYGWFAEDTHLDKKSDKTKINKAWYTSFNSGAAGPLYLLSKAYQMGLDVQAAIPSIQRGLELIETKYINRIDVVNASLHVGSSGIAASLATAIQCKLVPTQLMYVDWINRLLDRPNYVLGFARGIAGQGIAHWLCQDFIPTEQVQQRLFNYTTQLLDQQEKDGSWLRSHNDKKKRVTCGFAGGMAGIIYFLLEYAQRYKCGNALTSAQQGLCWLMKKAEHKEDVIQWKSASNKDLAPWWHDGAPGIALCFMKAYTVTNELRYKEYAMGALRNHHSRVTNNSFSQSHGLSGLGEIYLEAYYTFKDKEWLERAGWIAQLLMHAQKQHTTHGPYWLVEHEREPVAGFMIGNSGILHFLLRYCYPERIGFPLLM